MNESNQRQHENGGGLKIFKTTTCLIAGIPGLNIAVPAEASFYSSCWYLEKSIAARKVDLALEDVTEHNNKAEIVSQSQAHRQKCVVLL